MDIPKKIYLQIENHTGDKIENINDATWCPDRINPSDIPYFRKTNLQSENEQLQKALQEIHDYLLEAIKPWDIGHKTVFEIAEKALEE